MYVFILIFPFFGCLLSCFFGRFFGNKGSAYLSIFFLALSWLLSLFIFYEVCLCQSIVSIKFFQWFVFDIYNIRFGLLFDALTSVMLVIVCTISFLVHLYSLSYMSHDPYLARFMGYLSFFTFFMLVLVTSDNFLQLFLG